jgi:hypothetical protein
MKLVLLALTISTVSQAALTDEGHWWWPTEFGHPSMSEICPDDVKNEKFPNPGYVEDIRQDSAHKLEMLSNMKGKRVDAAREYFKFFENLEFAKSSFYSAVCTFKKTRHMSMDLVTKAGALCDENNWISLKASFAKTAALMPERTQADRRKKIIAWNENPRPPSIPVSDIAEYSFLYDTDRLSTNSAFRDKRWPNLWTESQRREACGPFTLDSLKLERALKAIDGTDTVRVQDPQDLKTPTDSSHPAH